MDDHMTQQSRIALLERIDAEIAVLQLARARVVALLIDAAPVPRLRVVSKEEKATA